LVGWQGSDGILAGGAVLGLGRFFVGRMAGLVGRLAGGAVLGLGRAMSWFT
jgi:hypothetical protein